MRIQIAYISPRRELKSAPTRSLLDDYVQRVARFIPVTIEPFRSQDAFFESLSKRASRVPPRLVLLDSRGRSLTSVQFSDWLALQRDSGTQDLLLAIGPPDGWTPANRTRADLLLSLGPMTLPHELALVVLAEQVYRGLTILAGHPYHSGHEIT